MKILTLTKLTCGLAILFGSAVMLKADNELPDSSINPAVVKKDDVSDDRTVIKDRNIQLCQVVDGGTSGCAAGCQGSDIASGPAMMGQSFTIPRIRKVRQSVLLE